MEVYFCYAFVTFAADDMDKNFHLLQLTEGDRTSRRNTSIICAIALAWAASQFDLKTLSLGMIGSIDLTNATIPLILAVTGIYTFLRCMIEYAMQPKLARQWKLAQIDFRLLVWLVRATAFALGVSSLSRSLETIISAAILMLVLLVVAITFWFVVYRSRFLGHGSCRIRLRLPVVLIDARRSYAKCVR